MFPPCAHAVSNHVELRSRTACCCLVMSKPITRSRAKMGNDSISLPKSHMHGSVTQQRTRAVQLPICMYIIHNSSRTQ